MVVTRRKKSNFKVMEERNFSISFCIPESLGNGFLESLVMCRCAIAWEAGTESARGKCSVSPMEWSLSALVNTF